MSIDEQIAKFVKEYSYTIPDRGLQEANDPNFAWRERKPDYRKADLLFFQGKSKNHLPGSLEFIVENLVKKWEMEMTHFKDEKDWTTVNLEECKVQVNGGEEVTQKDAAVVGTYNWILKNVSKEIYDAQSHKFESSHALFRGAFLNGFPWEVLEVFSGPPKVAFTWRHWGTFNGEYNGQKGNGEVIELYGFTVVTIDDNFKITKLEIYIKPEGFLQALKGKISPSELKHGTAILGSCCPIYQPDK